MPEPLIITDTIIIPAGELHVRSSRSSGPGGQNVNKVETKVELRFDIDACAELEDDVKDRLRVLAKSKLDADGCIVLTSQQSRSKIENIGIVRSKLQVMILAALTPPKKRIATRASGQSKAARIRGKKLRSKTKSLRGKIDLLDEEGEEL